MAMDSSLFLSPAPGIDVFCPPRKGARVSAPFLLRGLDPKGLACHIDSLPDECLYEILRRLRGLEERSLCACVSKRWLMLLASIPRSEFNASDCEEEEEDEEGDILDGDGCIERILEGKEATDVHLASIALRTGDRLTKLSIRGSSGVSDVGLTVVARMCPSLRVLEMWDVPLVSNEGMSEVANGCPSLEVLDLIRCPLISDKGMIPVAENCLNLYSLLVESCPKIGNECLQALGRCSLNLQSISISNCPLVGDQGIQSLVSSTSSSLTKIKLQALNITDASLGVIGVYGREVTDLVFTGLKNVNGRGFWVMGAACGLQKLQSITIISCHGLIDLGFVAVAKGCPVLKRLYLKKCCNLSDAGLKAFAGVAACLENLQVEECDRITLFGVVGVLSSCNTKLRALTLTRCMGIKGIKTCEAVLPSSTSLKSLTIRGCVGFDSSCLAMVGKLCPQLQHMELSGLMDITDATLLPLIERHESGLVKVRLSECLNITDAIVSTLAREHGGTLQVLNLEGCRNVTDKALLAIAEHCFQLKDLDVSRCGLTDFGIASLACARQLNLKNLSLAGCGKVSSLVVPLMSNIGRSLIALNIQKCNQMSRDAIQYLEEKMWWCDVLS